MPRLRPCLLRSGVYRAAVLLLSLFASGCERRNAPPALPEAAMVSVPAATGAATPHVARWGDRFLVSWIEPAPPGHALRFATWDGGSWSAPRSVASGTGWFVNWADFPSVIALDDSTLIAHWLQRSAASGYAYDVLLARSGDGGETWSQPVRPHRDGTATEHGFVSLYPDGDGVGVVWLDGRQFEGPDATKEMTVRFTTLGAAGVLGTELALDERACDCCQTAVALTADGPIVAYRDRTQDEIRDIVVTRRVNGQWTEPQPVHDDRWHIDACPVNGPQADAAGRDVAIAWFTAASDSPRVMLAFSDDAGATFAAPRRVDDGNPLGRVDVVLTDAGDALVVWLERDGDVADLRARLVSRQAVGPARTIAQTSAQRPSGFPRMARSGDTVLLAWTNPADSVRVLAASLTLPH